MATRIEVLRAEFNAVTTKFNAGLKSAEKRFGKFRDRMRKMSKSVSRVLKPVGLAIGAIGAAITGMVVATTVAAAKFEKEMSRVRTLITKLPQKDFDKMRERIKKLSKKSGKPLAELASGLFDVISAGVDTGDAMDVLEKSTTAAIGGVVEVGEAFGLVRTIIKGYGLEWSEVGRVSDIAFKINELGVTSIGELSQVMGRVAPLASKLGISFEELAGAYATLTGSVGNTRETTTKFNALLNSIVNPTEEVADTWNTATLKAKGLVGMMKQLAEATGGNIEEMKKFFPAQEALTPALVLAGTGMQAFIDKTEAMRDATGATQAAHDVMADDLIEKWNRLRQTLLVTGVELGEAFVEPVGKVVGSLTEWFDANEVLIKQKAGDAARDVLGAFKGLASWWGSNGSVLMSAMGVAFKVVAGIVVGIAKGIEAVRLGLELLGLIEEDQPSFDEADDPRLRQIQQALDVLKFEGPNNDRAEQIQLICSRQYEDNWQSDFDLPATK